MFIFAGFNLMFTLAFTSSDYSFADPVRKADGLQQLEQVKN